MGNTNFKSVLVFQTLLIFFLFSWSISWAKDEKSVQPKNLADAFNSNQDQSSDLDSSKEVEPIVVGRDKWTSPPDKNNFKPAEVGNNKNERKFTGIEELDPLETKQDKNIQSVMPLEPPTIPPAVKIHRNFEGKLVLKPRKFGFERDYPFQLQNSRGKRLAYIDFDELKSIDPISLKDQRVNILGKLEPLKEGSDKLFIRARILRKID
jgi:hypothetical protein